MTHTGILDLVKEVGKLFKNMFKRPSIRDEAINIPKELRNFQIKSNLVSIFFEEILNNALSCLPLLMNTLILSGHPILGIAVFMLYRAKDIFHRFIRQYTSVLRDEERYLSTNTVALISNTILDKVSNNVYIKKDNYFHQASNEEILNSLSRYLPNSWNIQVQFFFDILRMLNTAILVIISIVSNSSIPQALFIPILLISCSAYFLLSTYEEIHYSKAWDRRKENRNARTVLLNDILRIGSIIPYERKIRIQRLKNLNEKDYLEEKQLRKTNFFSESISTIVSILCTYVIIIFSLISSKEPITLSTITTLIATIAIFETAIRNFSNLDRILQTKTRSIIDLEKEENIIKEILKVFHKKSSIQAQEIDNLDISSFSVQYAEQSENDKPFNLILNHPLTISKGDIIALTGPSGSGKSTFMKLATGRISFQYNDGSELVPTNYIFYDETVSFGSFSIWQELFCLEETKHPEPSKQELEKMEFILKNLFLWKEISENCKDFWEWTKQHKFNSLSNGQKQRLILAKILFWLNDTIDILALDECTSGLDAHDSGNSNNADALKVLSFIIDYCNRDKQRILLISTHQDIGNLCNRRLHFEKEDGKTIIQEL